jgi:hypothetical protein
MKKYTFVRHINPKETKQIFVYLWAKFNFIDFHRNNQYLKKLYKTCHKLQTSLKPQILFEIF